MPVDFSRDVDPSHQNRHAGSLGVLPLQFIWPMFVSFDYAAGFVPAPPMDPFPVMPYEQDAEKECCSEELQWCWRANATSHRRSAISSAADLHSMKSAESRSNIPADLIVMPTHGRTGLSSMSSLAAQLRGIVQHSPCPVFVCARKEAAIENRTVAFD